MDEHVDWVRETAQHDRQRAAGEFIAELMPNAVAVLYKPVQGSAEHKIFDSETGKELGSNDFYKAIQEGLKDLLAPAYYTEELDKYEKVYNKTIESLYYWLSALSRLGHLRIDVYLALNHNERTMTSDEWRLRKIDLTGRLVDEKDYKVVPVGTTVVTPEGKQFFIHENLGWFDPEIDDSVLGQDWMLALKNPYTVVEELPKWVDDAA